MNDPISSRSPSAEIIERLENCRLFDGPAKEFWRRFAQTCGELVQARATRVMVKREEGWRLATSWPSAQDFPLPITGSKFEALASRALGEGLAVQENTPDYAAGMLLLALDTGDANDQCLLVVALVPGRAEALTAAGEVLRLAADTPLLYQRQRQLERAKHDLENFAQALEVLAATNVHTRFLSVAMALVNELAARLKCSRVSLGWTDGTYIRVMAISGTDRFEKRMDIVQKLEAAMEEARDQDEEIFLPAPADSESITRDHQVYAETERLAGLLTVPVRVDGEVRGVLALERDKVGFGFVENDALAGRVVADQVARRLDDLRNHDRWFGARWAIAARKYFGEFLGPQHTWLKVAAIATTVFLLFAIFVPLPYRVNASFIVRANALTHMPAPFDGYLAAVAVRPGDLVKKGDLLAALDKSDLEVELAAALAERQRSSSEAEKAEADRKLADLRVARAMEAQAQAKIDLIRYRLDRAEMHAPYDGVVVEGDLHERIGAPVKQGDVLMKVSQLADLYVEMRVPERDVDLVEHSRQADIAFTTRPEDTFKVGIDLIEPSADAERDGNVFVVRGHLDQRTDWLRPGMSGVAKIESGSRSLLWIATHRLVDFLRLKLWW